MNARTRWAQRMIAAAGGPIPSYGSAEWVALPDNDRRKAAAVVMAAECWAREADELEDRLRAEVELLAHAHKVIEDAEYVARAAAHREQWKHLPRDAERHRKAQEHRRETYGDDYGSPA